MRSICLVLASLLLVTALPVMAQEVAQEEDLMGTPPPPEIVDPVKARAALLESDRQFAAATAANGLEGWLSYFAQDARIFPEKGGIVTGLPAIQAHYEATGFTPDGLTWRPEGAEVASSGDLGFTYGTWEKVTKHADGTSSTATGKYLTVWRLDPIGAYQVLADIGNMAPPED